MSHYHDLLGRRAAEQGRPQECGPPTRPQTMRDRTESSERWKYALHGELGCDMEVSSERKQG